jgi:long-chain acyl-CoA synthetase
MAHEFYELIRAHAQARPDHPAIIDGDATVTYRELVEMIDKFASALGALDLNPDSKLGVLCLNQKEYFVAFLGALRKGVPFIPFNYMLTPDDLAFIAQDAGIDTILVDSAFVKPACSAVFKLIKNRIFVTGEGSVEALGEGALSFEEFLRRGDLGKKPSKHARNPIIPDVILYTSGTTARPKGVMLNESHFYANTEGALAHVPFLKDDRVIMALPLFHSYGSIIALIALRGGATLILMRQFAPKGILNNIARHKGTILPLAPTIFSFLVDLYKRGGYDASSLKFCVSGSAALPEALLHDVENTLGATVIEGYGLTETAPIVAVNSFAKGSVPGSVGPVLPNVKVKIVNEAGETVKQGEAGEICVQGPSVMLGYWNRPEETRATLTLDGWLKTGDLGHLDEKNLLYISGGRKKDIIIRAGENVSPLMIENALLNHPAVAEAAAVGIAHPRMGEQVKVFVALRQGAAANPAELKEYCRKKLPAFMVPDVIQINESLPKTATGKIIKSQLRDAG